MDEQQKEVDLNYEKFLEKLPEIREANAGKYALMRHGNIDEFFDSAHDAYVAGKKLYSDGIFSVQQVVDLPVDLGFFSHAMPERTI